MSDKEFLELMYDAVPKNRNNIVPLITISRNKAAQYDGPYMKPGWYVYKPGFFNVRKSLSKSFFQPVKKADNKTKIGI